MFFNSYHIVPPIMRSLLFSPFHRLRFREFNLSKVIQSLKKINECMPKLTNKDSQYCAICENIKKITDLLVIG